MLSFWMHTPLESHTLRWKGWALHFKQTVAQSRDEMGTWTKSEWLWTALKTSLPCTAPREECFPNIQKEVSVTGRPEGWWSASSRGETSGKIYFVESGRKCTDIHSWGTPDYKGCKCKAECGVRPWRAEDSWDWFKHSWYLQLPRVTELLGR